MDAQQSGGGSSGAGAYLASWFYGKVVSPKAKPKSPKKSPIKDFNSGAFNFGETAVEARESARGSASKQSFDPSMR